MMKTLIVYAHLIATCIAIGTLLIQDWAILKTRGTPLSAIETKDLQKSAHIMFLALVALWATGLALVTLGYLENPNKYLTNQKLWGKFSVVSVLTLNGVILHYFSFPRVTSSAGLLKLSTKTQMVIVLTGAISTVSWLFASYLGIARPWNYTVNYGFVMFIYASLLVAASLASLEGLHFILSHKSSRRHHLMELSSTPKT